MGSREHHCGRWLTGGIARKGPPTSVWPRHAKGRTPDSVLLQLQIEQTAQREVLLRRAGERTACVLPLNHDGAFFRRYGQTVDPHTKLDVLTWNPASEEEIVGCGKHEYAEFA